MTDLQKLATAVVAQAEAAQAGRGEGFVLAMAVTALVQTHPDPAAFAAAFQRCWQLSGTQHSNSEAGPHVADGIDQGLSLLEDACQVPLGVRPGR